MGVESYSTNPDNNGVVGTMSYWPTGMLPSEVDNTGRQMMADLATLYAALPALAAAADVWLGTAVSKYLAPKSLYDAAAPVTLADAATITPDFGAGINFTVTLAGNRTLANPTNAKSGQSGVIRIQQDATGARTLTFGTSWLFVGAAPPLSTSANTVDLLSYYVHASGVIYVSLRRGYPA